MDAINAIQKLRTLLYLLLVFTLGNCTPKVGYVRIEPRTTAIPKKINRKLNIFLDHVKDSLLVESGEVRTLKVTGFRSSVGDGLRNAFLTSFNEVNFTDHIVDHELTLHVYRIEPYWHRTRTVTTYNQGQRSEKCYEAATFQYQVTLLDNGKELSRADDKAMSYSDVNSTSFHLQKTFIDGLKVSLESIHESIVITHDIDKKLN